jgi:hypothetical protein
MHNSKMHACFPKACTDHKCMHMDEQLLNAC